MNIDDLNKTVKFVPKGWGYEKWLVNNAKYCGKILFMVKGKKLSWHYHRLKDEHFYISSGSVKIYFGTSADILDAHQQILSQGDVFHVPVGLIHRLEALEDSHIIEISTQHFDEDSIRVEKGD